MKTRILIAAMATASALVSMPALAVDSSTSATSNTSTSVNTDAASGANTGISLGEGTRINGGIKRVNTGDAIARTSVDNDVSTDVNTRADNTSASGRGSVSTRTDGRMSSGWDGHRSDRSPSDDMRDRGHGKKYGHDRQARR